MKAKTTAVLFVVLLSGIMFADGKSISKYPGVTVRTLVDGSPLHGSNGLYFGPDGNLYIACFGGNEIIKMDPNSGRILDRIGVYTPDDLTFGPDGSLYWTTIMTGDIGRLFPDGSLNNSIVNLGPGVNPITFSPDNQWIYVARDFLDKGLFKIRPDGSEPTPLLPDLVNFNGFDFGPDGWLYGPLYTGVPKVIKVNATKTPPLDPASDVVDVLDGIAPSAVKFDSTGRLVTNDNYTGEVLRYNLGTGKMEVLASLPFNMDNLAIDSHDQVYVSSDKDGYIAKILPKGNYVLLSPGGMIYPSGVAALSRPDGGESVFVGDMWNLREFDGRTGKILSSEDAGVLSQGLASFPFGIAPDIDNRLLISSSFNNIIQRYNSVEHTVLQNYVTPIIPGVPFMPMHAIRFDGDIVAADAITGLVVRESYDAAGNFYWNPIFAVGGASAGLATDGSNIWVSNYALGTIFEIGSLIPLASGLSGPEGIAYYPPDGSLLVVESDAGRLLRIDPEEGTKTVLVEGLELGHHLLAPWYLPTADAAIDGVAVGPSGAIYVTGNMANVLYRIEIHR